MSVSSPPLNSLLQLILLASPFLLLAIGILVWIIFRKRKAVLAWAAITIPIALFLGVTGTTYYKHSARTAFLSNLIIVPEELVPGRVLTLTMYGEGSVSAYHLTRTGVATDVITALQNDAHWRHDSQSPILDLNTASLYHVAGYGETKQPFAGTLEDIDYLYVTGKLNDFVALDPVRWGAMEQLGYDLGLVSLIYDVSDGLPINLVTSEPIYRFASTQSVHFQLPNWSTHWALDELLQWDGFTPKPMVGQTRFDVLAERLVSIE